MNDKDVLRQKYRGLLKNQSAKDRLDKSERIAAKLWDNPHYQKAKTILAYASMAHEVETFGIIRKAIDQGKRVCLPLVEKSEKLILPVVVDDLDKLRPSTYGIKEPVYDPNGLVEPEGIALVLVPGLAFDAKGYRLGQGAGYYDRFLSRLPKTTATLGLAFDFQLTDCLPHEQHDLPVWSVIAA